MITRVRREALRWRRALHGSPFMITVVREGVVTWVVRALPYHGDLDW
jgi:hypothetical protein